MAFIPAWRQRHWSGVGGCGGRGGGGVGWDGGGGAQWWNHLLSLTAKWMNPPLFIAFTRQHWVLHADTLINWWTDGSTKIKGVDLFISRVWKAPRAFGWRALYWSECKSRRCKCHSRVNKWPCLYLRKVASGGRESFALRGSFMEQTATVGSGNASLCWLWVTEWTDETNISVPASAHGVINISMNSKCARSVGCAYLEIVHLVQIYMAVS